MNSSNSTSSFSSDDDDLSLSNLSQQQLQSAKILTQCLCPISQHEYDLFLQEATALLTTRVITTESAAYGLVYLDGKMVMSYTMSSNLKLKINGPIEVARGTVHRDVVSLKSCLIRRCGNIFPNDENINCLVNKIIVDTFEYQLATLRRHELFIYLIATATVFNIKWNRNESVNKTIERCVDQIRNFITKDIPHPTEKTSEINTILQLTLVISSSIMEPEFLRRRLSQPIQ